jgi:hypothetical protein
MPFISPYANVKAMLLNDRAKKPWIQLEKLEFYSETTGETYVVPKHFRHDGASVPAAIVAVPVVGPLLFLRFFGKGVFQGFREGVLHDWLRQQPDIPAKVAHLIFREALYEAGYPSDLCENYYAAVKLFNS